MRLPRDLSGDELAKALTKLGYEVTRQPGSHLRLATTVRGQHHVTVPRHRALRAGTLADVLADVAEHHGLELKAPAERREGVPVRHFSPYRDGVVCRRETMRGVRQRLVAPRSIGRTIGGALGCWTLALLAAAPAHAGQNLFVNPDFSSTLLTSGWTVYFGVDFDWTGADANACPGSGAGQLPSATFDTGIQWAEAVQCVEIDSVSWSGGAHTAFSYFRLDGGSAYLELIYHTSADCGVSGGSQIDIHNLLGPSGAGWHRVAFSDFAIPPTANSVWVGIGAEAYQIDAFELLFDRAYFGREAELLSDDFETGSMCHWSATVP